MGIAGNRKTINRKNFFYDSISNLKLFTETNQEYQFQKAVGFAYSECIQKKSEKNILEESGLYSLLQSVYYDADLFEIAQQVFKLITGIELSFELLEKMVERKENKPNWQDLMNEISLCCPIYDSKGFYRAFVNSLTYSNEKKKELEQEPLELCASEIHHLQDEELKKYWRLYWKHSQKEFCSSYSINIANFSAWLCAKRTSLASSISVKLFLLDIITKPMNRNPERVKEIINETKLSIPIISDTELVLLFKMIWKSTEKEFCQLYGIDYSNFSAWLERKRKSIASSDAVKLLLQEATNVFK